MLGFVLGSSAAIALALFGTVIVFLFLRSEHPQLEAELSSLLMSAGLFAMLTVVAAFSFYGQIKTRAWRHAALVALLLVLITVAGYHGLR
jgi:hypothetical protein